ncbi:tripeptidyl-peptidase [Achlya hypogyna]|uniref:subtilisin n=1 Tax=Achlya hypogyna TaxID=1202772 RepID=A0A1V9YM30_ACHHY|nr:tripeptidyl-peptidase [Achlya hypogyna]
MLTCSKLGLVLVAALAHGADARAMQQGFSPLGGAITKGARALADEPFHLAIGVKAGDEAALETKFWEVSTPGHASYGRFLSAAEADALTAPAAGAVDRLQRWLRSNAINDVSFSATTNRVTARTNVRTLEALLDTTVHEFEASSGTRLLRAATPIHLPDDVAADVTFLNINAAPVGRSLRATAVEATSPIEAVRNGAGVTPSFLRDLYKIPRQTHPNETNLQGIPEFYNEAWAQSDVTLFFKEYMHNESLPTLLSTHTVGRDDSPEHASAEASLDLQYITAIAPRTPTLIQSVSGANPFSAADEPFVEWAEATLQMERPPYVVSLSYSDDEAHIFAASETYARSFDTLLMKMGTRGMSVLMSSGDDGVAGQRPNLEKIKPQDADKWCARANPQWPTSSPYLTSVGATMLARPSATPFFDTKEEVVCSSELGALITSGGGFSDRYPRPSYQDAAVRSYLNSSALPSPGFFNASGRAYPDVAAFGANFKVVIRGSTSLISGTSASAPVFAGVLTLINDLRLNAGKPPLGFVNPLLYQAYAANPLAFNDVVVGSIAAGMGSARPVCAETFRATRGWDAASGLGTPNFEVLSALLAAPETWVPSLGGQVAPVVVTERLSTLAMAVSAAAVAAVLLLVGCTCCYVRRAIAHKAYQELDVNKPDTPMYPSKAKLDAAAIFTIDDEEEDDKELELTEVNLK